MNGVSALLSTFTTVKQNYILKGNIKLTKDSIIEIPTIHR